MDEQELLQEVKKIGAVLNGHFVYASGRHGDTYVEKQNMYQCPWVLSQLCRKIAENFIDFEIDSVMAPAGGGTTVSYEVAKYLWELTGRKVVSLFANRIEENLFTAGKKQAIELNFPEYSFMKTVTLYPGDRINRTTNWFDKRRGSEKYIRNKRILVVDDNLTTGASISKVMRVAKINGGKIVGLGVLWNRGGVTLQEFEGMPLFAPINLTLDDWDEKDCPLCKAGVPISVEAGHGKEYIIKKQQEVKS